MIVLGPYRGTESASDTCNSRRAKDLAEYRVVWDADSDVGAVVDEPAIDVEGVADIVECGVWLFDDEADRTWEEAVD